MIQAMIKFPVEKDAYDFREELTLFFKDTSVDIGPVKKSDDSRHWSILITFNNGNDILEKSVEIAGGVLDYIKVSNKTVWAFTSSNGIIVHQR